MLSRMILLAGVALAVTATAVAADVMAGPIMGPATKIERPGVMQLIEVAAVTAKLDELLALSPKERLP